MRVTLKALRRQYHMTQSELATLIGATQVEVSRYEKGTRKPRAATMKRIREIFDLTAEQIWNMFYEGE